MRDLGLTLTLGQLAFLTTAATHGGTVLLLGSDEDGSILVDRAPEPVWVNTDGNPE